MSQEAIHTIKSYGSKMLKLWKSCFFSQFFDPATYTVYRIPISFFPWPCGVAYTPGICNLDEISSYHMHPISTHKFSNTEEQARCIDGKSQILRVLSCKAKQLRRKHWMEGVLLCVVVLLHLVTHKNSGKSLEPPKVTFYALTVHGFFVLRGFIWLYLVNTSPNSLTIFQPCNPNLWCRQQSPWRIEPLHLIKKCRVSTENM